VNARARIADQYGVSNNTNHAKQDTVESALLLFVRETRNNQVRNRTQCVTRNSKDLYHRAASGGVDRPDNSRQESRVTVKHGITPELCEAEYPDLPVLDALPHIVPMELCCFLGVPSLALETSCSKSLLLGSEEIGRFWGIGKNEPGCDT
jgi:hypothetical protein